ncbi:unnamed protein product [Phyllotreta striolata]|uniref:tRNA pseudouridine synthase n=1 Tax=Phyllotreta striolata TaxID=444603 RepID=A0A9N9XQF4_PHYSR|nr:unnamed protein product [Phyllotreta striolata]
MSAFRYLMNIAYIGAPFRGSQRQVVGTFPRKDDPLTIQGRLETALKYLSPHQEPVVYLSSSSKTFDVNKMEEGAKLLEGHHDFRSFVGKGSVDKVTRRCVEYIKIEQAVKTGYSPYSWPNFASEIDDYVFLNIYIKSNGFLYRQVRRIIAALVALADGKVTIRDIKFMLEIPSRHSWCPQLKTAPAHGLYLCQVEYSKEDLDTFRADLESDLS